MPFLMWGKRSDWRAKALRAAALLLESAKEAREDAATLAKIEHRNEAFDRLARAADDATIAASMVSKPT